jgi:diacylglycerol kinase family enzyme
LKKKIFILSNPFAGKATAARISAVARGLEGQGVEVSLAPMSDLAGLPEQIAGIIKTAPDMIVAAGGDGTVNKIMPHLYGSRIPLAILPFGTANVLAETLNIPQKLKPLLAYILHGKICEAWPGEANGICFCCMASVGFDANVVAGVNLKLKSMISKGAYVIEALRAFLRHRDQEFVVTADDRSYSACGAVVSLTPLYGGRFVMAPGASPFAKDFKVILFKGKGRLNLLRYIRALGSGKIATLPDVDILTAREIEIRSDKAAVVQVDGDIIGNLPVRLVKRDKIFLVVPAA